jgi:hypothetical protein
VQKDDTILPLPDRIPRLYRPVDNTDCVTVLCFRHKGDRDTNPIAPFSKKLSFPDGAFFVIPLCRTILELHLRVISCTGSLSVTMIGAHRAILVLALAQSECLPTQATDQLLVPGRSARTSRRSRTFSSLLAACDLPYEAPATIATNATSR